MIRRAALALLLCGATTHAVAAQALPELRLEAGYARVRQPTLGALGGNAAADAGLYAIFWRRPTERWTLYTSGNLTYARDSLAAAQGVAAVSFPWAERSPFRTDVGLAGATFSLRSAGKGGNVNAFARQHWVTDRGGAWVGASQGGANRDRLWSRASALDAGGWGRLAMLYASGSVSRLYTSDELLLATAGLVTPAQPGPYELEDWQVVLQLRGGPHDITGSYTRRRAVAGADFSQAAFFGSATLQLTDRVALVGGVGRQLADPVRGLPQADLVTASLRVAFGPKPLPVMQRSTVAEATVWPGEDGGGMLEVRVFAIDTLKVEVAGDFSAWQPLPLERDGSFFVARIALRPGKYHVGVRTDAGPWRAPRNLARVRDDFGGESGLIVIP